MVNDRVRVLPAQSDISVKEVAEEFARDHEQFECVAVLAIYKNGDQYLRTSRMDQYRKSFLLSFFSSWIFSWFDFKGGGNG